MSEPWKRIEIDGQAPTVENLQVPALVNYGHYTSMQVRDRGARGLELHLARVQEATQELYGGELDAELVRDRIRHALGDDIANASAREPGLLARRGRARGVQGRRSEAAAG